MEPILLLLPETCVFCQFENLKLWGHRTDDEYYLEVRCMCCGNLLWKNVNGYIHVSEVK